MENKRVVNTCSYLFARAGANNADANNKTCGARDDDNGCSLTRLLSGAPRRRRRSAAVSGFDGAADDGTGRDGWGGVRVVVVERVRVRGGAG